MFKNYLVIVWRNLFRNTVYTFINIGGLAVGVACAILIFLWVWDETTFDGFHSNYNQLGRLITHNVFSDKITTIGHAPLPLYEYLKTYDPRIKNTCVSHESGKMVMSVGEKKVWAEVKFVSPEFLDMFKFPLLQGSTLTALKDPSGVVIRETLARTLFGDQDALGQVIQINNKDQFKVTGVVKEWPENSSFDFAALITWTNFYTPEEIQQVSENWKIEPVQIFVEWQENADIKVLNASLTSLLNEKRDQGKQSALEILPMKDWHLRSRYESGKQTGGRVDYVNAFSIIGAAILLIACINFMNLATARSEKRSREVGIRKCMGSQRKELIKQFLGESILITAIAFLFGLLLVAMALPFFNNLVDKKLWIDYAKPMTWITSIGFILVIGIIAGSYPSLYLSSFNPAKVLKGALHVGRGNIAPRKILVSIQFFASIFLMVGTVVIYLQMDHVRNRDAGYDRENLLMIDVNDEMKRNLPELERNMLQSGIVKSVTVSSTPVTDVWRHSTLDWPGRFEGEEISFAQFQVGYHYTETMGISVLQGRDFSEEFATDSSAILLNKSAVEVMGLENPIGTEIRLMPYEERWHVIGVVDDVIMKSPTEEVEPGFFMLMPWWVDVVTIRLNPTVNRHDAMNGLESIFKKLNPSYPFESSSVASKFEKKYFEVNTVAALVTVFSILSVLITSLGLLGLAMFTAEQRTKEIGIRRVLGASTRSILQLFTKDYTSLVAVGFVLAAPLSWWALNQYLSRYAYRIEFYWWIVPIIGALLFLLMLAIISTQVLKAVEVNPAETLRNE
jgi:ABC-type antimicrobial peptide transport system permease subunit